MLRSALPFKISVVGIPNNLLNKLFLNFNKQTGRKSSIEQESVSYTKNMSIDTIPIQLHLRIIPPEGQDAKKRLRVYQGSIGMFYIFEKGNKESFNEIMYDFLKFKDFYQSMNSNPVFLEIPTQLNQKSVLRINEDVEKFELNYWELNITDSQSFEHFLRKYILNSESFQAATQGSCDINP